MPDRYIEFAAGRKSLEWSGVIDGPQVRLADEWQNVAVEIKSCGASQLWVSPIETVSESEEGFERVYQGSQIMAVWNVTLDPAKPWSAETLLHVTAAH
jgi:alpha-amylase